MQDIDKLDRKRSYGLVYGDPNVGFIQDGHSYKHDGTLFAKSGTEAPVQKQGEATIPPAEATDTVAKDMPEGLEEVLEKKTSRDRSEAMRRIWAARKETLDKESNQ